MANLTVLLKKIPVIGLLIGAFIIGGAGFLGWSRVPSKVLDAEPALVALFDSELSSSYAFIFDGSWDGALFTGMQGSRLKLHSEGKANIHDSNDSGLQAGINIALAFNGADVFSASGDLRTVGEKLYLRVNQLVAPIPAQGVLGKWFVSADTGGTQSLNLDDIQRSTMSKGMFHLAEDLGTEKIDGVQVRNIRVTVDEAALSQAMKNGNGSLSALGKRTANDTELKKFADELKSGTLVLSIDGKGRLHRATWTRGMNSQNPDSLTLRLFDHGKRVTIDEPTGALPFAQLMSLIKLR